MRPAVDRRFQVASCEGKFAFTSANKAWTAAKRRPGRIAYHCSFCGKWHVGTNTKEVDRRKWPEKRREWE